MPSPEMELSSFFMSATSASRARSSIERWNSRDSDFAFAVHLPTVRNTRGKSFGPTTMIRTRAITIISVQPMSSIPSPCRP